MEIFLRLWGGWDASVLNPAVSRQPCQLNCCMINLLNDQRKIKTCFACCLQV